MKWTKDYTEYLEKYMETNKDEILDIMKNHTNKHINFHLYLSEQAMKEWQRTGIDKKLKLNSTIALSNMVCFD